MFTTGHTTAGRHAGADGRRNQRARSEGSPIVALEQVAEACRVLGGDLLCVAVGAVGLEGVNSDFSRSTGDSAIAEIHRRLRFAGGDGCVVERIDGGRFLVLVAAGGDGPMRVRRLMNAARRPIGSPLGDVVLGCAAGVTVGPSRAPLVLFDGAIRRLERALERGAGTIEWVDASNRPRNVSARLAAPLLVAVAAGEIVAEVHPVVWLSSGAVMELEASATWPAQEDLTSLRLIEVARNIGMLADLRAAFLTSAVDRLWRHGGSDGLWRVSINVGALELTSTSFVETMLSQLIDAGLARTRVQIDISDAVPHSELASISHTVAALRGSGVRVALDGLRYGAVSWSSLDGLNVDAIKVEADLLTGEPRSGHADAALRSVLDLAEELGLDVVATCVETPEQRDRLLTNGFVFGQGPLFAEMFRSTALADQPIATPSDLTMDVPDDLRGDARTKQVTA